LNVPQLSALLTGGKSDSSDEEVRALTQEVACQRFDAMCEAHGVTPHDLARLDNTTLEAWMREQLPEKDRGRHMNVGNLRQLLSDYLAECGE
jgi:hypothetical protein